MHEDQLASLKSALPGISWPALPDADGARMQAAQYQLSCSERLSPDALWQLQGRQLKALIEHALSTVPWYRERLAELRIEADGRIDPRDWRKLPVLQRADVQAAGTSLLSPQPPKSHGKPHRVRTSGSTGMPITAYGTAVTRFFWQAFTLREHLWHGRDFSGRFAAIRPEAGLDPGQSTTSAGWGPSIDCVFNAADSSILSSSTDIEQQADWLLEQNPHYLHSLPSNIRELALVFKANGNTLPQLKEIRSYGEVAHQEIRDLCEEVFGARLTDMYSCQEAGYIALQCPRHRHYHLQSENLVVEILNDAGEPCAPGEIGQVVVSTLHNFAMPLIRYALGDYARVGEPCDCGRGLPVVSEILGRERNMVRLPDGRSHYPSFPSELWMNIGTIRQLQLAQTSLETITARLVCERPLKQDEQQAFTRMLQERFDHPFNIEIDYRDQIGRSKNGKYEDFVSELEAGSD